MPKYIHVQDPTATTNRHRHSRCHYKRNSGSAPAGTNNPPHWRPCGATKPKVVRRRPLRQQRQRPPHLCSVPRTARARTTAAPRTTRPVALTLRQDRRHLWQAKQATLHLRHNDHVKKGVPRRSISYPFLPPLSPSCYRDRERGYSERDPSLRRKRAPSPPTDQRFEGWPLGRVRQPP
jgi:hypothetical protein